MSRLNRFPGVSRRQFVLGGGAAVGLATLAACTGNGGSSASSSASSTATPQSGGTIRFGYYGGTSSDTLDAAYAVTDFAVATSVQISASLLTGGAKTEGTVTTDDSPAALAESIEAEGLTSLVVRLKPDLTFHSGQPITAEDVLASFARFLDPNNPGAPAASLREIDIANSAVVDARTVRFALSAPNAFLVDGFTSNLAAVYPGGQYDQNNGSGPWRVKSFQPGQAVEFTRFDGFPNPPLADELVMQNFADDTAKLNALRSGAIDIVGKISPTLAPTLGSGFSVYRAETGGFPGLVMDAQSEIFRDPRVRQAFRLMVDREALIEQVLGGAGRVGNDVFSPYDDAYVGGDLPQREQDIDQAKSLLKAAGKEGLTFDMYASGAVPNLEVAFAQQARAAGVTINVKTTDPTTFFSQHYGQDPFYVTLWPNTDLATQIAYAIAPGGFYPEGNWDNPDFLPLWESAKTDLDKASRDEKMAEIQRMFHEDGTHIIWAFNENIDAAASNVAGIVEDESSYPLSFFDFTPVGFA
ncbi:ABC transporter substrate-binding protein [Blastococcus sp. SYSU D00695]